MKVILLKSVPKVGKKDDVVEVAVGFAQHALFPKKVAIPATDAAIAVLRRQRQNSAVEKEMRHTLLDKAIVDLNERHLTMPVKANDQGSLFSKVGVRDVVAYLEREHRVSIDPAVIQLPAIKHLGTYTVTVADEDYRSSFTIEFIQE